MIETVAHILIDYREGLVRGLLVTLSLCAIVWIFGLVFGVLFGALGHHKRCAGRVLVVCSFFLSSVPFLIVLFWLHYPLQEMLQIVIHPFFTAALALSLLNIVMVAQIVRNALQEFHHQYVIAGKVCGLSDREILAKIEFPIVLRQVIPQFLSLQVYMLQMTLFASLISVGELFRVAQQINASIYKPIEIYTTLALFFIAICLPLNLAAYWLKIAYTRNLSET